MLEILILIALTRRIGNIVEEKGHNSGGYKILTVVLWFGGEILGAIIGVAMAGRSNSAVLIYIVALIGAGVGAGIAYAIANGRPIVGPPRTSKSVTSVAPSTPVLQADLTAKLQKLKEVYDTGLITAQEYETQKAEILSRLVNEPAPMSAPIATKPLIVIEPSSKSPIGAALLSFLGQWKKGLVLILATLVLGVCLFFVGGIPIGIISVGDAYGTAKKLSDGNSVGEWEFNVNWKVAGLVTIIYTVIIGAIVFLASLSPSR